MTTDPLAGLLTTADVAEQAGISPRTVRWHVESGTIPSPLGVVGRTYVWRAEDLKEWLATPRKRGRPLGKSADKQR